MSLKRLDKNVQTTAGHAYYGEFWLHSRDEDVYLTDSWFHSTGFRLADILKDPRLIAKMVHPDDLPIFEAHIREAYEKQKPGEMELRIICPDGEIRWINHACVPVFNKEGQYTGTRGTNWDVTDRKEAEAIIRAENDLGRALDKVFLLTDALRLCLETAIKLSKLDAGGIYVFDEVTGELKLISILGVSSDFSILADKILTGSERTKKILDGKPVYINRQFIQDMQSADINREQIHSAAVIPFGGKGRIIGCLSVASRIYNDIPAPSRNALESIARQIGAAILRTQAEQDLRESEEKYRTIFENAIEGMFQTTPEGKFLSVNPAMARIFGYDSPSALTDSLDNVVKLYANPEDRFAFYRVINTEGIVQHYELLCKRKDGKEILIDINARSIRDKDGRIIRYDGFYEDITDRKRTENKLRKSEERCRMIVENMHDIIWVMDLNLRYKYRSPSSVRVTGRTPEEIMTLPVREQVVPESYALVEKLLAEELAAEFSGKPLDSRRSRTVEVEVYHKDGGTVWIEVTGSFIRDENGKPVDILLAGRNITERKKMQKEKDHLRKQLIQAQKMEAIGTLAGGIAHDFNNILASMMGFTEMAINESRQTVRRDYLDQVLQASERAKNLVNQILSFSRQREQARHPVDIGIIIQETLTLLRATLPTTIEMQQRITREPTTVLADPTQIHQIIMNLCTNAAQAMTGKSGMLDVHLSNMDIDAAGLSLQPDLQPGPYVQLAVRDTGCGIDPAIRDRIFDPFFTTKKGKEGTGLGLSVIYGIVKSYGGGIDVQSTVGEGTTFAIYLPRIPLEKQVEEGHRDDTELKGDERILFVDDEAVLVKMVKIFFQKLGYSITATTSSERALRLFQKNPERFDLVITDMTMPQMTGAELSREFFKVRPELPVILCTGYSDAISTEEVEKLNIRELVLKPLLLKDLGLRVRRVLDKR